MVREVLVTVVLWACKPRGCTRFDSGVWVIQGLPLLGASKYAGTKLVWSTKQCWCMGYEAMWYDELKGRWGTGWDRSTSEIAKFVFCQGVQIQLFHYRSCGGYCTESMVLLVLPIESNQFESNRIEGDSNRIELGIFQFELNSNRIEFESNWGPIRFDRIELKSNSIRNFYFKFEI